MKPAPFRYAAPSSVDEALGILGEYGDEAKVLAGGQSLGPLLNLRLAAPEVLVDVNRLAEPRSITADDQALTLGATVRQREAEQSALVAERCPLLAEALPYVAHRTIRNRGTIGGSIAHADPAAEIPAVALASDARLVVRGRGGSRELAAADFFHGYFSTALEPDELLCAVRFPCARPGSGAAWVEFAPRHGDFAIVGIAASVQLTEHDSVASARLVCAGVADVPLRLTEAERCLTEAESHQVGAGAEAGDRLSREVAAIAAASVDPAGDLVATAEYRRHLVELLTARAVQTALRRARNTGER